MRFFFCCCVAIFAATQTLAQNIDVKMSQIARGSYAIYDTDNGRFVTYVFLGQYGREFVVDVVQGRDPNGDQRTRYWQDASGNTLRYERPGATIRFSPHNCRRVVGECTFTEIGATYETRMIRINTPTRNGFSFVQFAIDGSGNPMKIREGEVARLDDMGMFERATQRRLETNFETQRLRQIQAVYR